jgi:hypothetical protein
LDFLQSKKKKKEVTAKKKSPTTANHLRTRTALGSERKRQLATKSITIKSLTY